MSIITLLVFGILLYNVSSKKGGIYLPKKQTEWSRAYNEKAYDRLAITIPKGQKATIQAAADTVGESVNQYTQKALLARMGLADWPKIEQPNKAEE